MSSRLFQVIREKLGLVYFISSSPESSNFGGSLSIHLGTGTKNNIMAVGAIKKAIQILVEDGITNEELEYAKQNLINTQKLQYENTAFVSLFNAKSLSKHGFIKTKQEILEKLEKVTKAEVNALADFIYAKNNFVIAQVGKDMKTDLLKEFNKA